MDVQAHVSDIVRRWHEVAMQAPVSYPGPTSGEWQSILGLDTVTRLPSEIQPNFPDNFSASDYVTASSEPNPRGVVTDYLMRRQQLMDQASQNFYDAFIYDVKLVKANTHLSIKGASDSGKLHGILEGTYLKYRGVGFDAMLHHSYLSSFSEEVDEAQIIQDFHDNGLFRLGLRPHETQPDRVYFKDLANTRQFDSMGQTVQTVAWFSYFVQCEAGDHVYMRGFKPSELFRKSSAMGDILRHAGHKSTVRKVAEQMAITPPSFDKPKPVDYSARVATIEHQILDWQANKDATGSLAAFQSFPVLGRRAKQARSSRTWGVELEVIDAGNVHKFDFRAGKAGDLLQAKLLDIPAYWSAVRDGSLRNMIGDGKWYDPWEFVSPIFTTTFDDGLKQVCDQVQGSVKYGRAGVHVHVGSTDRDGNELTTHQAARLLHLYNAVSPLFAPVLARSTTEFCKPFDVTEWATGWFGRDYPEKRARYHTSDPRYQRRGVAGLAPLAKDNAQLRVAKYKSGDDDNTHRYRDLNLESLTKHGTIEFRGLGAVYDYDTIVRWAWLCRELVNYAASAQPLAFLAGAPNLDVLLYRLRSVAVETLNVAKSDPIPMKEAI